RAHGFYCLGCCWALMLVMFAAGVANLVWMAALTAVTAYAKVGRRGEGLLHVTGLTLVVWGCVVAADPGWLPTAIAGVRGHDRLVCGWVLLRSLQLRSPLPVPVDRRTPRQPVPIWDLPVRAVLARHRWPRGQRRPVRP